ncbi:MAG: Wzz/FepE/Etk N-terminal domain-containing protein [Anaerolineae bacterium]|jgi:capsular polysaccharide biosynthesis protein|nr:Wzz/FepE/Etk N-terminal domain-containing protein [Anaerolineae bacterium]
MNLLEYAGILVRRGWIMVLLAVLTAGAAFWLSQQMTPVYRASMVVLMVPSRPDWGLQQASVQLLNSRAEYLRSAIVAAQVIDVLSLDLEPGALVGASTFIPNRDNMSIQIDVELPAPNDQEAAALINPIAGEWANQLIQYQNELNQEARREDRVQARVKDVPQISLQRPRLLVNVLIGAVAGFFLGAVLVFVLEFLESSIIRRYEDVERGGGLPVLAAIPAEN